MRSFDAIVIGSGQAGNPLAHRLADQGWTVALIEREHLGGTCVNFGCTPTKTMLASAQVAHYARRAADYGVRVGDVRVDLATRGSDSGWPAPRQRSLARSRGSWLSN